MRSDKLCGYILALALAFLFTPAVFAADLPTGPVILEVSGAITRTNADGVMRYDREMLEDLGIHDITTRTPWTDGDVTFSGVLGSDLMTHVGATGKTIKAVALNDYSVAIPISDFTNFGAIFATKKDGEYLSVRDRGPLWVIYPWSQSPALQHELYYSRSIWQLRKIVVSPN